MSDDDRQNLFDLHAVAQAIEIAQEALRKVMEGAGREEREQFLFQIGFAYGRLGRVCNRVYEAKEAEDAGL